MTDQRNNPDVKRENEKTENMAPDQETLHTTDPQEKMKGPVSDSMHEIGEAFDTDKDREEAEDERNKNM